MIPDVLQVVGLVLVTAGCALVAPWLAFVVGGLAAVLLGVALEVRSSDARKPVRETRDQG